MGGLGQEFGAKVQNEKKVVWMKAEGVDGNRTGLGGGGHGARSSLGSQVEGQEGGAQTVCSVPGPREPLTKVG